ncbi:MAG: ribosome silencing factor [Gammaproteobacteria bacterium]|nr:ribosome silencing factor [Gammaproteobacteria bacterium]MYJ75920.1 ribosome silencing factor [Gammaproteobacteria bacterium]
MCGPILRHGDCIGPAIEVGTRRVRRVSQRSDAVKNSELNEPGRHLAALVLAAVDDRKGVDPKALNVSALTELTDMMVIVSGTSNRHVKAMVDSVLLQAKRNGVEVLGTEGREHNDWVLIDLADVIVHIMSAEARRFYDLERLWEQPEQTLGETVARGPSPAKETLFETSR